jgi:serine/threonine-protein kinase
MTGAYLALDSLDRPVAIEVLASRSAADKTVLKAFQQAAHKVMEVQHPNVGRIVDTGEDHGLYFLVKEHNEGQTLDDILQKRGKIPYLQATRLIALALVGLDALHAKGVPAGDLTADCLLLAPTKESPHQRTVKILHAGIKRRMFDETAIGRSITIQQGIPDELELTSACLLFAMDDVGSVNPPDDIFRLGCIFYRCVTGQAPYPKDQAPSPSRPPRPVAELAPDVPEMLCQIIDQMIDPNPANRPQKAAHVAKSLRIFLATEQEAHEARAEENIVVPAPERSPSKAQDEDEEAGEEEMEEEEEEAPRPRRKKSVAEHEGAWGKVVELWEEVQPEVRDLVFLGGGALLMLALIFLVEFVTGLRLSYVAGLATGVVVSWFVGVFVRWRQEQKATT